MLFFAIRVRSVIGICAIYAVSMRLIVTRWGLTIAYRNFLGAGMLVTACREHHL